MSTMGPILCAATVSSIIAPHSVSNGEQCPSRYTGESGCAYVYSTPSSTSVFVFRGRLSSLLHPQRGLRPTRFWSCRAILPYISCHCFPEVSIRRGRGFEAPVEALAFFVQPPRFLVCGVPPPSTRSPGWCAGSGGCTVVPNCRSVGRGSPGTPGGSMRVSTP